MEKAVDAYIAKIDEMGGALASIEQGYMQREIQNAAYAAQKTIEHAEEIVVGVNKFQVDETIDIERLSVDPAIEQAQRAKLAKLRENRDEKKVAELRGRLETAAKGDENLMPLFIEAVEHDMTLGEIANVLRCVWGEYVAEGF